jgi:hypothetical protein
MCLGRQKMIDLRQYSYGNIFIPIEISKKISLNDANGGVILSSYLSYKNNYLIETNLCSETFKARSIGKYKETPFALNPIITSYDFHWKADPQYQFSEPKLIKIYLFGINIKNILNRSITRLDMYVPIKIIKKALQLRPSIIYMKQKDFLVLSPEFEPERIIPISREESKHSNIIICNDDEFPILIRMTIYETNNHTSLKESTGDVGIYILVKDTGGLFR